MRWDIRRRSQRVKPPQAHTTTTRLHEWQDGEVVTELALLNVVPGREAEFETAFEKAKGLISSTVGFISLAG